MPLKIVRINGEPVTLRSIDNKNWFSSPKSLLTHKRNRESTKQKLQREWATVRLDGELGISEVWSPCHLRS